MGSFTTRRWEWSRWQTAKWPWWRSGDPARANWPLPEVDHRQQECRGHPWQHLASEQVLHTFVQGCHLPSQRYPARLEACNGDVDTAPPPHSTHRPHPRKSSWANFYFLPQRNKVVSRHSSTKKKKRGVCVLKMFQESFLPQESYIFLGKTRFTNEKLRIQSSERRAFLIYFRDLNLRKT